LASSRASAEISAHSSNLVVTADADISIRGGAEVALADNCANFCRRAVTTSAVHGGALYSGQFIASFLRRQALDVDEIQIARSAPQRAQQLEQAGLLRLREAPQERSEVPHELAR
jgi:hypothetical protein